MIFDQWVVVFSGPVLYLALMSSEIGKIFFDNLVFLFYLDIPKNYFDNFFEDIYEIEKNILTGPHASVHFENGPHAKSSSKTLN